MGREYGDEAPVGHFTMDYYSPQENSTKCSPILHTFNKKNAKVYSLKVFIEVFRI